ncbi:hypothetical protein D3C72_2297890 [compost metagenome]
MLRFQPLTQLVMPSITYLESLWMTMSIPGRVSDSRIMMAPMSSWRWLVDLGSTGETSSLSLMRVLPS